MISFSCWIFIKFLLCFGLFFFPILFLVHGIILEWEFIYLISLLQFTIPGGRHATHHASLMQGAGAARVLRAAAAAAAAPIEAKIFARIVLRNLEHHHHVEPSI